MKKILARLERMERPAFLALHLGLAAVALCSLAMLSYVCRTQSVFMCVTLSESLPALPLSLALVFGGSFALDALLKERGE